MWHLSHAPPRLCLPSSPRRSAPVTAMHRHLHHHEQDATTSATADVDATAATKAIEYHHRTKHSLTSGYARGPHGLDWSNQPNPFLRFLSSPSLPLLRSSFPPSPLYSSLFSSSSRPSPQPLNLSTLSSLLYHSLSLSAWKTTGVSTWSLRVNPSSGNLHPTESHIISPLPVPSLSPSPFLAHYSPKDHSLELRAELPADILPQDPDSPPFFFISLSSVIWRESWKYGERAFRYCNHDAGHAVAAVSISAAALGWDVRILDGLSDSDLRRLLAIDRTYPLPPNPLPDRPQRGRFPWIEAQHPDCLLLLFPFGSMPAINYAKLREAIARFDSLEWVGRPNSLSKEHVYWDIIYRTAEAVKKPFTGGDSVGAPFRPSRQISKDLYDEITVADLVRKRRSAVDMDGVHVMRRDTFFQILLHCLPSGDVGPGETQGRQLALPFRALTWHAEVHFALFVHRVEGLPKGLYFLVRNEGHLDGLKRAMRPDFEWVRTEGCPDGLPLYRLARGNCERLAKQLSCHQDIASDGCFSLGMVAQFEPVLREKGGWMYPRLFWESGVLGQVLYLEAHAVGVSATGIGCYFDDDVHEVLGLKGSEYQSLYHFTIGRPVLDKRIMSLPAYPGPGIDA